LSLTNREREGSVKFFWERKKLKSSNSVKIRKKLMKKKKIWRRTNPMRSRQIKQRFFQHSSLILFLFLFDVLGFDFFMLLSSLGFVIYIGYNPNYIKPNTIDIFNIFVILTKSFFNSNFSIFASQSFNLFR
jgi:hypothetical protein